MENKFDTRNLDPFCIIAATKKTTITSKAVIESKNFRFLIEKKTR